MDSVALYPWAVKWVSERPTGNCVKNKVKVLDPEPVKTCGSRPITPDAGIDRYVAA